MKRTHELRAVLPPVWPTEADINHLIHKSSGQFIYAATVVKFTSTPRRMPAKQLNIALGITPAEKDTPVAELDALYHHIFSLVEDLPKVFDVLGCLFFLNPYPRRKSAYLLENILSYNSGELQLILIDLYSVIEVPDVGAQSEELRIFHASLQDFLMDPTRSRDLYMDKGKAHARIAQHFLRCINNYLPDTFNDKSVILQFICKLELIFHLDLISNKNFARLVFGDLRYQCFLSSPTRELMADLFDFDFQNWVIPQTLVTQLPGHCGVIL